MTFYISTAIDYPSAKPHLGHAYEKLCADCIARWHRLLGEDVFFSTGTDEHGKKIQRAAEMAGKKPKEFVDGHVPFFKELCKKWNISFDRFIRTTDPEHEKVCQAVFKKLFEKGDIFLGEYEGLYCAQCENYYLEKDLKQGNCPVHGIAPELMREESYFFSLSEYQKKLLQHLKKHPETIWPEGKRKELLNRLKEPLRDLSVSRTSFDWGIPIPFNKKHVMYVWTDALLNYLSVIGYPKKSFEKYWPADIHLIGVDILWFHYTIWFALLMSAGLKLPKTVLVHGFINTESGEKMSKSRGTVIDPISLVEEFGADPVRYFLLREIPFGEDGRFSYKALLERNNNELANELGNLVYRTLAMIEKYCKGAIPKGKMEKGLEKKFNLKKIQNHMKNFELHFALAEIFSFVSACNKFINEKQPWKQSEKEKANTLYSLADSLRIIAILFHPFIPYSAHKLSEQLGVKCGTIKDCKFGLLKSGTKTKKGGILFKKIEWKEEEKQAREISVIVDDGVKNLGLKVVSGVINNVNVKKKHEGLEKLKEQAAKEWKHSSEIEEIVQDYERVYSELSIQAKNSVRNLIQLVEEKRQLPQINTAVDCYNIVSLKHAVVVGAHDVDKLKGDVRFAITQGTEAYTPLGSNENIGVQKGEFGVLDEKQVLCRLDEKQCEETKIDATTKHIILYVQGNRKTSEEKIRQALKEICELVVRYCGGSYKFL